MGRFRNVNKAGVSFPNSTNHAWILENKLQSETDRNRPPIQLTVMSHQPRFSMFLVMSTSGFSRHEELCRFHLNRSMSDGQHRDSRVRDAAVDSRGNHLGNDYSKLLCWTSFYLNLGREVRYPFVFISVLLSN